MQHVVLLRAVNVGGHAKLPMAALRQCLASLGYENVQTVLQSGNVVLAADQQPVALQKQLQQQLLEQLNLQSQVLVRSDVQWRQMIAANPFAAEANADPRHVLAVVVTQQRMTSRMLAALRQAISTTGGREQAAEAGGHLFMVYPNGIGRSRVTTALVERALGTTVTARNWNTVLKLAALLD